MFLGVNIWLFLQAVFLRVMPPALKRKTAMTQNTELFLEKDGFYAGRKLKSGKLAKDAHKITQEEIMIMFSAIMRTYVAKSGNDTMMIEGDDGKTVVAKLVEATDKSE